MEQEKVCIRFGLCADTIRVKSSAAIRPFARVSLPFSAIANSSLWNVVRTLYL
jgi:hypothetical protein